MDRTDFDAYWESKGHQATDVDYKAYLLGQQVSQQAIRPTVEAQQRRIAQQIRIAANKPSEADKPIANHHPNNPYYKTYEQYASQLKGQGYGWSRADYEMYLRSIGITTDSDHEKSHQQIHKNDTGGSSIAKGEPDHIHDQKQGASTSKGIPSDKPKPPTPPAPSDPPPLPTQRTEPYTFPYKNLPFDPSRQPPEIGDPFYSGKYQDQLTKWSRDNWDRYQRKQPSIPKPLPPKETMAREREFLTSKQKTYDEVMKDTIKNTRFVPAKDVKVSI